MLVLLLGMGLLVLGAGPGSLQAKKYTFHDIGTLGNQEATLAASTPAAKWWGLHILVDHAGAQDLQPVGGLADPAAVAQDSIGQLRNFFQG
jgi:hypothetical protein